MPQLLFALMVAVGAIWAGITLYKRHSTGSRALAAFYGVVRNLGLFIIAIAVMVGWGSIGIVVGAILILLAVYLGAGHYENLEDSRGGTTFSDKLLK